MKEYTLNKVRNLRYRHIVEDVVSDDGSEDERKPHGNVSDVIT